MKTVTNIVSICLLFFLGTSSAFAIHGFGDDKGNERLLSKNKHFKSTHFSLRSHMTYKGAQILMEDANKINSLKFNSAITFKEGNTVYMLPYQQKIVLQRFKTPAKPNF